jgi:Putative transposase/Transposase zinc-binding domain
MRAFMACRTALLGGHVQRCPEGHVSQVWYNSCRHRMGPQCAWLQVEGWLQKHKARLLACDHYHVIFTLPSELHGLWRFNERQMANILFRAVHETRVELLWDAKYLGAQVGIIAALHTWSQSLSLHPHLHCLVTGGGLSQANQWRSVRGGFLLPVRVVMAVYRGTLLWLIEQALGRGELVLPPEMTPRQWQHVRRKLGRVQWNVHIRERYAHGSGVLMSLARYLRGGPLSNRRLLSYANGEVRFGVRGRSEGASGASSAMRLSREAFLRRYLEHVPRPGLRRVRHYGLYAYTKSEALSISRAQVGGEVTAGSEGVLAEAEASGLRREVARGEVCGRELVVVETLWGSGLSPPQGGQAKTG